MAQELIIYADESTLKGKTYSNFYGGLLVRSNDIDAVREILHQTKIEQNFFGEIKWSKVTSQYLTKYKVIMDTFFALVQKDKVKVRIMFTHNQYRPTGLDAYQQEHGYHLLYYQFIKHAFGLQYCNETGNPIYVRIYLDQMPHTKEKNAQFKNYLINLQNSDEFKKAKIYIRPDQIAEIDSRDHDLLQCLDVVLGAMQFRLNNLHQAKPIGSRRRGKRTIAKEHLYKYIRALICQMHPNFNIGITTGKRNDWSNLWHHSYRHWCFVPKQYEVDESMKKN